MINGRLSTQRGIAVAYILSLIALLAIVAMSLSRFSRQGVRSRLNFEASTALKEQVQLIRSRLLVCGVAYPTGDNGSGSHPIYPATPGSGLLSDAVCPGQPAPNNLWTGSNGLHLPPPPQGFGPWIYANDSASLRIGIAPASPGDATALGLIDHALPWLGDSASRVGETLTVIILQ